MQQGSLAQAHTQTPGSANQPPHLVELYTKIIDAHPIHSGRRNAHMLAPAQPAEADSEESATKQSRPNWYEARRKYRQTAMPADPSAYLFQYKNTKVMSPTKRANNVTAVIEFSTGQGPELRPPFQAYHDSKTSHTIH